MKAFFQPDSIAVIGASEALSSFGARYILALHDIGYEGAIYAVNHSGNQVLGRKIHRSILDVQEKIDLACISVPARFVPGVLRECVKKDVKAAIVLSAGFRESGEEGRRLEEEIVEIARQGIRVMGPNCFGTYCPAGKITVVPGGSFPRQAGGTALFAQSGGLSETIAARSFGEGVRYSKVASYGNACDVNEADLLEYFMEDRETKTVASYLEGVRDGRRFFEIAMLNRGRKPLLILKAGVSRKGAVAASSHTGSLAGATAVWDAFFRQTGAIKIGSFDELIDTMVAFSCLPEGCGSRVGFVSGGGGGAVISADACEASGLEMPEFGGETMARLRETIPAIGTSLRNPLDIGIPHPPLEVLRSALETIAASELIDIVVIRRIFFSIKTSKVFSGASSYEEEEELLSIPIEIMKKFNKPVAIIAPEELSGRDDLDLEDDRRRIRDYFFARNIPVFISEQRAFTALSHLVAFRMARLERAAEEKPVKASSKGRALFSEIVKTSRTAILDELRSKKILKGYGIEAAEPVLARSREAAVEASEKLGYPIVMKIASPQIRHKSDIGGVRIGLANKDEVSRAHEEIMGAAEKVTDAVVEGIAVQKMAPPGLELVIGMNKDAQFGPVLMFGLGGTLVEVLKDVAFRIVPLSRKDAKEIIREIKGFRLLEGYRGQPAVDISYIEELLLRVSAMIAKNPEIKEMDINPLIAYPHGAVAVDARVILENEAISGSVGEL